MNNKHIISSVLSIVALVAIVAFVAPSARADMCTTEYGGNETCKTTDLTINKQVKNPSTNFYVENLTTSDPTFAPGSEIDYRLIITNNSGETFNPHVKDTLPLYITEFIGGDPGTFTFDATNHILTFDISNLIAGETRVYNLRFHVAPANQFPSGINLFCINNVAEIWALNRYDTNSAQACLSNGQVKGVTTLPVTGFNDVALLLPFTGVALAGFALLRKAK